LEYCASKKPTGKVALDRHSRQQIRARVPLAVEIRETIASVCNDAHPAELIRFRRTSHAERNQALTLALGKDGKAYLLDCDNLRGTGGSLTVEIVDTHVIIKLNSPLDPILCQEVPTIVVF
jgi:hypothetical protein